MKHITYTDLRVFIVEGTKRVYFAVVPVKARLEVVVFSFNRRKGGHP